MKKMTSICMALFLAAGFSIMAEEAAPKTEATPKPQPPAAAPQQPGRPGGPNGMRRGPAMNTEAQIKRINDEAKALVEMYDANKDGKLDAAERAKMDADFAIAEKLMRYTRTKPILDALDADKDMKISEAEGKELQKVMREIMQKRFEQNGGPGRGARPGRPPQMNGDKPDGALPPPPPPKAEQPQEEPPKE